MKTIRIILTCPECGCSNWLADECGDEGFKCFSCGELCTPEQMGAEACPVESEF